MRELEMLRAILDGDLRVQIKHLADLHAIATGILHDALLDESNFNDVSFASLFGRVWQNGRYDDSVYRAGGQHSVLSASRVPLQCSDAGKLAAEVDSGDSGLEPARPITHGGLGAGSLHAAAEEAGCVGNDSDRALSGLICRCVMPAGVACPERVAAALADVAAARAIISARGFPYCFLIESVSADRAFVWCRLQNLPTGARLAFVSPGAIVIPPVGGSPRRIAASASGSDSPLHCGLCGHIVPSPYPDALSAHPTALYE